MCLWVGMSSTVTIPPRSGKGTHRGVPLHPDPLVSYKGGRSPGEGAEVEKLSHKNYY